MVIRQDTLCSGGPISCPDAFSVSCQSCGHTWQPEDVRDPDPCPACAGKKWLRQRCAECDMTRLDTAMQESPFGDLLNRAFRISEMRSRGFTITLADIDHEEARALEVIWGETEKYREVKSKERT